ncbi:MAG: DMT family transporter [Oligosphaeraceae bacterium]
MSFLRSLLPSPASPALGWLCGILATLTWGSFYPVSRLLFGQGEETVEPLSFSLLRFLLAALCLSPLLLQPRQRALALRMLRQDTPQMLLLAFLGILAEGLLVFWSTKFTTAARSSLMANTAPVTTMLLAWILGRETLTRRKSLGMALGLLGLFLFFLSQGRDDFVDPDSPLWLGDLMAFGSGCCWAAFTVLGESFSRKYGGMLSSLLFFATASLILLPVALLVNHGTLSWNTSPAFLFSAVYLGALSGGGAIALWYAALRTVPPARLGSLGFLSASLAVTASVLLTGERPDLFLLCALAAVLAAITLMNPKSA